MEQLIARKQWNNRISTTSYLLYQLIRVGLGSLANHKGW